MINEKLALSYDLKFSKEYTDKIEETIGKDNFDNAFHKTMGVLFSKDNSSINTIIQRIKNIDEPDDVYTFLVIMFCTYVSEALHNDTSFLNISTNSIN